MEGGVRSCGGRHVAVQMTVCALEPVGTSLGTEETRTNVRQCGGTSLGGRGEASCSFSYHTSHFSVQRRG